MEYNVSSEVHFKIKMDLTESEARALDALACYGTDEFIDFFYKHMGKSYLSPHEAGLRSLFDKVKSDMSASIGRINHAKIVLKGLK
jgi:hypothetical protein